MASRCWFCGHAIRLWQRRIRAAIPEREEHGVTFYGSNVRAWFHAANRPKSCADSFAESMDWWTLGETVGTRREYTRQR